MLQPLNRRPLNRCRTFSRRFEDNRRRIHSDRQIKLEGTGCNFFHWSARKREGGREKETMSTITTLSILFAVLCAALVDATGYPVGPYGGYQDLDVNDPEAQTAGRLAAAHLEREKNTFRAYRLHRLISARKQVVSGVNYRLELIMARTNCYRGQTVSLENCRTVKVQICNATIHLPLQSDSSRLLSKNCGKEIAVNDLVTTTIKPLGGETEIDVTDEGVIDAASFATQQLTNQSNGRYRVEIQKISRATFQVVSGFRYRLIATVSLTDSGTNEVKSTECEVQVLHQSWLSPPYVLLEYNCDEFIA